MTADYDAPASLRFPHDDSPGEGLTAGLSKGVCVFCGAADLSEEGMGFGVPAVVSRWRTYLSFTAPTVQTSSDGRFIRKVFQMDAVQCVGDKHTDQVWPYLWLEAKGKVYKSLPWAQRWLLDKRATGNLTPQVCFTKTSSLAAVPVEYRLTDRGVRVKVDLTTLNGLPRGSRVYALNEQGGRAFPVYLEDGRRTAAEHKSGWAKVTGSSAGFATADRDSSFLLRSRPGAVMYHGREVVDGQLSWSGIEYDVTQCPEAAFEYLVEVGQKGGA